MSPGKEKKNPFIAVMAVIIIISLLIIVLLEYLDYEKGKDSFIFTNLLRLEQKQIPSGDPHPTVKSFTAKLLDIIFDQGFAVQSRKDRHDTYHLQIPVSGQDRDSLVGAIHSFCRKNHRQFIFLEMKKTGDQTTASYKIHQGNTLTHLLQFTGDSPQTPQTAPSEKGDRIRGKLALIIDDVGYGSDISMQLKNLGIPITASIIPSALNARDEARRLSKMNIETMIHIPMESRNNSYRNWDYITSKTSRDQMRAILERARDIVPDARGVNNHMGSLLTQDPGSMTRFLSLVKNTGLFFIDSRTSQNSQAYLIARDMGLTTAARDVFIDHRQEYNYTRNQLKKLVRRALEKGQALGIGHPFPTTLRAIRDSITDIKQSGVEIVFVSTFFK